MDARFVSGHEFTHADKLNKNSALAATLYLLVNVS